MGGFQKRIGGSVRVSPRDPTQRLPPLIPLPPVKIQLASPIADEDEDNDQNDIVHMFQQASSEQGNGTHPDVQIDYTGSPHRHQPLTQHWSHSQSPKRSNNNFMDRKMEDHHRRFERGDDQMMIHGNLGERQSSPAASGVAHPQQQWQHSRPSYHHQHSHQPTPPTIHTFDDQFDEFVYKSQHIAHCEPTHTITMATGHTAEWGDSQNMLPTFSTELGNQSKLTSGNSFFMVYFLHYLCYICDLLPMLIVLLFFVSISCILFNHANEYSNTTRGEH